MGRRTRIRVLSLAGLAFLCLMLASCGGGNGPDTTPTPGPTATPEPTATPAPETALGAVQWSTELAANGEPGEAIESFWRENDTIVASVQATSLPEGETLTATWSINGVPIDGMETTVEVEPGATSGWVSFSLTWNGASLWPTGTLEVMITASSGATATASIPIVSGQ